MNKRVIAGVLGLALLCTQVFAAEGTKSAWKEKQGMYAIFETSMGKIVCELFDNEAPKTVSNFTGLAEGKKEFLDSKTGKKEKKHFYDGLIFHRVIPKFMIQGGDPTGTGMGGPGYKFEDEIAASLKFDQPGKLAMANSGPGTNGSQFFITETATPWLNGHHTIFGQVVEGMDVVTKITSVERGVNDRPVTDVVIKKLTIETVAKAKSAPEKKEAK